MLCTFFTECLVPNHVSDKLGHIAKLQFDEDKARHFMYYSCIQRCRETKGCAGITFRESTNSCWLKSSNKSRPMFGRSFLPLNCLDNRNNILYPGYQEQVNEMLARNSKCPEGYEDWLPYGDFCYNLVQRSRTNWFSANDICNKFYHGGSLTTIDSSELNAEYLKKLTCESCTEMSGVWIGWKMGKTSRESQTNQCIKAIFFSCK